eukprot:SAG11_NODE_892_length_6673_cov_7.963797_1_plen_57_part_00
MRDVVIHQHHLAQVTAGMGQMGRASAAVLCSDVIFEGGTWQMGAVLPTRVWMAGRT